MQFAKWVRHIGWQLADAGEYLLTSVASRVSRRRYQCILQPLVFYTVLGGFTYR